jgi:hypothetical protein
MATEDTAAEPAAALPDPYEVVPTAVFDHAVGITKALVGACMDRDAALAGRLCDEAITGHGVDGVLTTAMVLAEVFAVKTGLGTLADQLTPEQCAQVVVTVPGAPPMFAPHDGFHQRRQTAHTFAQLYILGQEDQLYAELKTRDHASHIGLLHGLCELAAAFLAPARAS